MTRLRAIGFHVHDHFEVYGLIVVWMSATVASSLYVMTGNIVFAAGCAAYMLIGRLLDRQCVRWCKQEFAENSIDFDAVEISSQ